MWEINLSCYVIWEFHALYCALKFWKLHAIKKVEVIVWDESFQATQYSFDPIFPNASYSTSYSGSSREKYDKQDNPFWNDL